MATTEEITSLLEKIATRTAAHEANIVAEGAYQNAQTVVASSKSALQNAVIVGDTDGADVKTKLEAYVAASVDLAAKLVTYQATQNTLYSAQADIDSFLVQEIQNSTPPQMP